MDRKINRGNWRCRLFRHQSGDSKWLTERRKLDRCILLRSFKVILVVERNAPRAEREEKEWIDTILVERHSV
jgi:hypothetical protein